MAKDRKFKNWTEKKEKMDNKMVYFNSIMLKNHHVNGLKDIDYMVE